MLGRWNGIDPSCEKYYSWSPYTYCKNNPVLRVDPDGKDDYVITSSGRLFNETSQSMRGKSSTDKLSYSKDRTKTITIGAGVLGRMYSIHKKHKNEGIEYYGSTMNLEDAAAIFKFGTDNTDVEWKLDIYDNQGDKTAIVGTSGKRNRAFSNAQDKLKVEGNKIVDLHSHPNNLKASDDDMRNLKNNVGAIYYKKDKELFFYNSNNPRMMEQSYIINTSSELLKRLNDKFMK